jgi:hypothetical protein
LSPLFLTNYLTHRKPFLKFSLCPTKPVVRSRNALTNLTSQALPRRNSTRSQYLDNPALGGWLGPLRERLDK